MHNKLNYRYIARLIVEAQTPIFVGSGNASLLKDALAQKDHNGLPMIPGTALAGVLRHSVLNAFEKSKINYSNESEVNKYFALLDIFGCQFQDNTEENKEKKKQFEKWYKSKLDGKKVTDGLGSRLKISSAYLLIENNKIAEGVNVDIDPVLRKRLGNLPLRQHVKITDKGVASGTGLFDNEIVYKGAKFIFEIELDGTGNEEEKLIWEQIINTFKSPLFRVGQGTRKGYGNLKVEKIYNRTFDLEEKEDFDSYLNFDPSFNSNLEFEYTEQKVTDGILKYKLSLKPDSFFIFSEGFGDKETDNKPITEDVIEYGAENGKISFTEKTVIPASSIKGAIAHRVCYHYNKKKEKFADQLNESEIKNYIGDKNDAVSKLFGKKGEINPITQKNTGKRGILIMDDLYYDDINNAKMFNHVAIDRFTGGAIDGALFSEKVSYKKDGLVEIEIYLTENEVVDDILKALEESLKDICKGLLPLGGMTTKGHGMFTGSLKKNEKTIFPDNQKTELCQIL